MSKRSHLKGDVNLRKSTDPALQFVRRANDDVHPEKEDLSGRLIDILAHEKRGTLDKLIKAHITKGVLAQLHIDAQTFRSYVYETKRRLGLGTCTVNQLVGTFHEVVGDAHPVVVELRTQLIDLNSEMAIKSLIDGSDDFVSAGSASLPWDAVGKSGIQLPWKNENKALRLMKEKAPPGVSGDPIRLAEWNEAKLKTLRAELDLAKIEEVIQLTVNGLPYCDRANLLRLKDGRYLVLLTEEYKTIRSGELGSQSAARDNRLLNSDVSLDTVVEFSDMNGTKTSTVLGKLVLNASTTTSDRMGVKASKNDSLQTRIQNVTKGVKKKKETYGDDVKLGDKANAVFFVLRIKYPGDAIRNFFEALHRESPQSRK